MRVQMVRGEGHHLIDEVCQMQSRLTITHHLQCDRRHCAAEITQETLDKAL